MILRKTKNAIHTPIKMIHKGYKPSTIAAVEVPIEVATSCWIDTFIFFQKNLLVPAGVRFGKHTDDDLDQPNRQRYAHDHQ